MENEAQEISIGEVIQALWSRRLLIAGLCALFGLAATGVAMVLPAKYQARVVLSPVTDDSNGKLGGASALLSQFGGLAGLGGVSLGNSGQKSEAIATLASAALTEAFIREKQLLPTLYADVWDANQKAWTVTGPDKVPSVWKAERKFREKIRSVGEDKKTGLVTLSITWTDPALAATWANELVVRANRSLRDRAINQSKRNLDYLNEQLAKSNVLELQKAIYGLIEAEIKKVMIANGSDEYAFKVIDPARVPEEKSSPRRGLIVAVGAIAGLILGALLALALPRRD